MDFIVLFAFMRRHKTLKFRMSFLAYHFLGEVSLWLGIKVVLVCFGFLQSILSEVSVSAD